MSSKINKAPEPEDARPIRDSVVVQRSYSFEVREDVAQRAVRRTLRVLEGRPKKDLDDKER